MWENHVLRVSNIWLERIGTITYTHYGMCFAHEWYQPINAHAHASGLNIPGLLPVDFFLCWHFVGTVLIVMEGISYSIGHYYYNYYKVLFAGHETVKLMPLGT